MGKALSAKHLCGNSFPGPRFLSKRRMSWTPQLHLDVKQWLKSLGLLQYAGLFIKYKGVEELLPLSEGDIKAMGVTVGSHRARMMSSLVYLKRKYEKNKGNRNKLSTTNSTRLSVHESQRSTQGQRSPSPNNNQSGAGEGGGSASASTAVVGPLPRPSQNLAAPPLINTTGMEPLEDPSASPQQLRKALEWELSLDGRDLRSHAWYHGTIPRQRAEELMAEDGDFLIRDCISQPGDYVLTCRWKNTCLHFVINKVVIQPNTVYERIQFQFEDDSYDTVPDLVTFYVGSGKPISSASGARIGHPVNRSMPLTFYATKYGSQCLAAYGMIGGISSLVSPPPSIADPSPRPSPFQSPKNTPNCSPPTPRREIPPRLPDKVRTPSTESRRFAVVVDGQVEENRSGSQSQSSGDSVVTITSTGQSPARRYLTRVGSEPMLSPTLDRKRWDMGRAPFGTMCMSMTHSLDIDDVDGDKPPPKPSRVPSVKNRKQAAAPPAVRQPCFYYNEQAGEDHNYEEPPEQPVPARNAVDNSGVRVPLKDGPAEYQNGSDSGNGSGDSVHSGEAGEPGSLKRKPGIASQKKRPSSRPSSGDGARYSFMDRRSGMIDGDSAAEEEVMLSVPDLERPSCFDLTTFATMMLPKENKPLDGTALNCVHSALLDTGSRVLANHITRVDVEVLRSSGDHDLGLGVVSGIELMTLPQGTILRKDLLERLECTKLFVAITILTCMNETQRAELVHKWIHVAIDTKTALGNLYSFTGIMLALGLPQIQRLKCTWHTLRLKYTDSAFTYETKLRPTFKAMNEGTNPQAPNTCIPHLLPLLALLERPMETSNANQSPTSASFLWEATSSDYGIQLIHSHLEAGRAYVAQCTTFRRNTEIVLENVKFDELLLDTFRTEFHLRFLWGTKGATVSSAERHAKFQQVLMVMSERCEPST